MESLVLSCFPTQKFSFTLILPAHYVAYAQLYIETHLSHSNRPTLTLTQLMHPTSDGTTMITAVRVNPMILA